MLESLLVLRACAGVIYFPKTRVRCSEGQVAVVDGSGSALWRRALGRASHPACLCARPKRAACCSLWLRLLHPTRAQRDACTRSRRLARATSCCLCSFYSLQLRWAVSSCKCISPLNLLLISHPSARRLLLSLAVQATVPTSPGGHSCSSSVSPTDLAV